MRTMPTNRHNWPAIATIATAVILGAGMQGGVRPDAATDEWPSYGHDPGGSRYSPLAGINRTNVSRLSVAWVFHTGDVSEGTGGTPRSGFESTPILVDGTLYVTTPFNRVIALDPETGTERWAFDPKIDRSWPYGDGLINRGVASWLDTKRAAGAPCRRRIFEATLDARLVALDAATGTPCADFGDGGQVMLTDVSGYRRGVYHITSPPVVLDDLVVVGSAIDDNSRTDMPAGVVRAFDARSGARRWKWDPISPNQSGTRADAWQSGAANAWSVMAVDPERHLVFVPTGSASPDYFGGMRPGDNKWANSVVALRGATGEMVWGFQLVHHDLWDYDTAAPPLLATIRRGTRSVPVVVQGNKTGFLYVLDRETGTPVFPVEERPVPQSDVPGEGASRTQPFPIAPPPVSRQQLSPGDAWGTSPEERAACQEAIRGLRNEGVFTPPSIQGSLVFPGNVGGMNWSGYAFDPRRSLLVVNTNDLPAKVRLVAREAFQKGAGKNEDRTEFGVQAGAPYAMARRFMWAKSGLPCNPPPWGSLSAVDLSNGSLRWQVPLGSFQNLVGTAGSIPPGGLSLGGPIVTAGGLTFIAGTLDAHIRAFDTETGKELWVGDLPTNGNATPMTYRTRRDGKQYLVVSAGGHAKVAEAKVGDALIAFAVR